MKTQNIIIFILFIAILFYSFFIEEVVVGLIAIIFLIILLRVIHAGTYPVENPFLWVILIIIVAYVIIIGEWLWGLIGVVQITILWLLIYRLLHREEGKIDPPGKRTMGITVLAVLYAFGALIGIFQFFSEQQICLLGITLFNISAQGIRMFFILIDFYLVYGFIKLHKLAWIIAVIYGFYGLLNLSINIISFSLISSGMAVPIFGIFLNSIIILYLLNKVDSFTNKITIYKMRI